MAGTRSHGPPSPPSLFAWLLAGGGAAVRELEHVLERGHELGLCAVFLNSVSLSGTCGRPRSCRRPFRPGEWAGGGDPSLWLLLLCLQKQNLATLPWMP